MVTERTLIKDQPLIFTTAPPDISAPQHSGSEYHATCLIGMPQLSKLPYITGGGHF